jgi:hypothetical protein
MYPSVDPKVSISPLTVNLDDIEPIATPIPTAPSLRAIKISSEFVLVANNAA